MGFRYMITRFFSYLILLYVLCPHLNAKQMPHLLIGTVLFSRSFVPNEGIPIWRQGQKIESIINKEEGTISFDVHCNPYANNNTTFIFIVSAKPPVPALTQSNHYGLTPTVFDHLVTADEASMFIVTRNTKKDENGAVSYTWNWEKKPMKSGERIPDDAIIMVLDPSYIKTLHGGSEFELPTFITRPDIATLEQTVFLEAQLRALDLDSFHVPTQYVVKENARNHKNVIVIPVT